MLTQAVEAVQALTPHGCPSLTIAFMMISSLRMQATMATFLGLPAETRRS